MAGPTPVSALIHAATMVTSGLYMIARMNFIYVNAPVALTLVLCVGSLTALVAASMGLAQYDIKKVLAYSTVSQLGFMFMGMGAGAFSAGMFHVFTHAFFKAALFLGSGSVILACHHEQDMRNMGGLRKFMPWTFASMGIATLAIAGIFPFSGLLLQGRDPLEGVRGLVPRAAPPSTWCAWIMGMVAAFMTAFYMVRLMVMTFFGEYRGARARSPRPDGALRGGAPRRRPMTTATSHDAHGARRPRQHHGPKEVPWNMWLPVAILALLALVGGFLNIPHSLHWIGSSHFSDWIAPLLYQTRAAEEPRGGPRHRVHPHGRGHPGRGRPAAMGLAWWFYGKDPAWSRPRAFVKRFPDAVPLGERQVLRRRVLRSRLHRPLQAAGGPALGLRLPGGGRHGQRRGPVHPAA